MFLKTRLPGLALAALCLILAQGIARAADAGTARPPPRDDSTLASRLAAAVPKGTRLDRG